MRFAFTTLNYFVCDLCSLNTAITSIILLFFFLRLFFRLFIESQVSKKFLFAQLLHESFVIVFSSTQCNKVITFEALYQRSLFDIL